jgi:hypothetical protein
MTTLATPGRTVSAFTCSNGWSAVLGESPRTLGGTVKTVPFSFEV